MLLEEDFYLIHTRQNKRGSFNTSRHQKGEVSFITGVKIIFAGFSVFIYHTTYNVMIFEFQQMCVCLLIRPTTNKKREYLYIKLFKKSEVYVEFVAEKILRIVKVLIY